VSEGSLKINESHLTGLIKFGQNNVGMKKLFLLAVAITGIATVTSAQVKKAIQTVTIKTPTVQCESCKNRIEGYLKREDGVQKATVDFKRKTTKVTFVTERTNIENIKTAIANSGYDADDVTADTEAYKKLPKCCKKPEDGGGMEH
jgi:periplasmic mercuric ion binding protein